MFATIMFLVISALLILNASAHDKMYAQSHPISPSQKQWFDQLKSGKGPCCSDADGSVLTETDWESSDGHYRVRIDGKWIDVPDDAVLKVPNLYGPTMVWPLHTFTDGKPVLTIRCFMPGMMT